jgi:hypothetical protein
MKVIVAILALSLTLSAALINAVAIVVGGKPITLYEIQKVVQQHNLSENEAAEFLVQRALEDIEMEKLGIDVSEYEVMNELEKMAASNGLNVTQLEDMIVNSGIDFESYKEEFARKLKQRYLFDAIGSRQISNPSNQALQVHYENNKDMFTTFESANVVQYLSNDKIVLQRFIQNPFSSDEGIAKERAVIKSGEVNPNIIYLIQNTKEKSYTPVIDVGGRFLTLFIESKVGEVVEPFEKVKDKVVQSWRDAQREDAIKMHFQEVRADTDIQIIR